MNFTIIIPHKNIPELLERCLRSIPSREDLQVIIVDDNSDSNIVNFDKFPGLNQKNVKVIFDKSSLGAGHARNVGLDNIDETRWVLFADSDDFFSENINEILNDFINSIYDIIFFKYKAVFSDTLQESNRMDYLNEYIDKALLNQNSEILRYKIFVPYGKLISFSLIKKYHLRFEEIRYSNDALFSVKIGHYAKNVFAVNKILYTVTQRTDSLINTINLQSVICRFNTVIRILQFLKSVNKEKYHSNLFAYTYNFAKISKTLAVKYFFKSFYYTPVKYWYTDLKKCYSYYKQNNTRI